MTSQHVEQLAYGQDRALVGGVRGERILYLSRAGVLCQCVATSDAFEIPRCSLTVATAEHGPRRPASVQEVIDRVVDNRRLLRAVWWPGAYGGHGKVISEEAIGVVMLDDPVRQAPTSEEWAAAAVDLRSLEGRVR